MVQDFLGVNLEVVLGLARAAQLVFDVGITCLFECPDC